MLLIEINRFEGESELDFHKRIVNGKLVDKTLADYDYTEIAEAVYGQPYSSDVARRMLYGSRRTLEVMDRCSIEAVKEKDVSQDLDNKMVELKKERQKLSDERTAYNALIRKEARKEELIEIIQKTVSSGVLPVLDIEGACGESYTPGDRNDLLVSLNDIHYGATHDSYWGSYNTTVCRAMMEKYAIRVVEIAKTHNSENCYIYCGGDAISGSIHKSIQVTNKENVVEQVMGVSELISEFIAYIKDYFNKVIFFSVAGNHSRVDKKEDALIGERLDDLVGWYLEARLQNYENVVIEGADKIDPTMSVINIRGKYYCGVHGDYDSPAKIHTLQAMCGVPLYAVISGHFHHNATDNIQGIKTIMAGSFQGMDSYCVQKRIIGAPEQMVCVCDEDGVLCHYDIAL